MDWDMVVLIMHLFLLQCNISIGMYRNVSMGIYQAFFALGIYYGDYVYVWIGKHIKNGLLGFTQSKSIFLIVIGITLISMLMVKLKVRDN